MGLSESQASRVYAVLAYQFGVEVAECFAKLERELAVTLSPRGRIRDVLLGGRRILTLRPSTGMFALTLLAGDVIRECVKPPRHRVIVDSSKLDLIKGSVLRPVVIDLDPSARAGAEVLVVSEDDRLLGVGKLMLPPAVVKSVDRGEVVKLREASSLLEKASSSK
ncbi:MAG: PUA domain-containing protein [Acidilobaceae archaeon]